MPTTTHRIPAERLEELQKRIAKINKKAAKLEKPPVSLIVGDHEQVTVEQGGALALRMGTKFTYEAVNVTVIGETPVINGWEFLTTVLHRPAGNEFVNLPGTTEADLSEFKFVDKNCDHCNKKRVRNATYIIRYVGNPLGGFDAKGQDTYAYGELKQVGSTCLGDFTGYHSPQAAAKAVENIYNLFRDLGGWGSTAGRTTKKFFLEEWLAFVAYSVRVHGFVSRNRSYDTGEEATADRAKRHILQAGEGEDVPVPNDDDFAKAREVITYIRDRKDTFEHTDFFDQLIAAYASDMDDAVAENTMGLTAAGFAVMWRGQAEEAKANAAAQSEWFGNAGDKITRTMKVTRVGKPFPTEYGASTPINFEDEEGHKFLWFASNRAGEWAEAGKTYSVTATIKKHDVSRFDGSKQTIVNRCKGTEIAPGTNPLDIVKGVMA